MIGGDKQFNLFLPHFLQLSWKEEDREKGVKVKNLYYLFEGRLYQELLILKEVASYQIPQSK
jgi:hypothetical protein